MALKEDELKALVSYIGIDPDKIEDLGAAKTEFNTKHISREMAVKDSEIKAAVTGAAYGSIFRDAKRTFKDLGVEFEAGEVADNDVKALFEVGKTKVGSRLEELTKAAPDVEKWQKDIEKERQRSKDLNGLLESTKSELEKAISEKTTAVKGVKLDIARKDIYRKLPFSSTIKEVEKRGFDSIINEKYKLDIDDETGSTVILDAKTNARIKSAAKSTEFATPEEIFTIEAEKEGLLAKVDPKRVNLQTQQRVETAPLNPDGVVRNRIAPANAK
jgi:hypothetical protein